LERGERYQFIHIPDLVHQLASRCINGSNATEVFQFAGAHDFLDLARLAIASFADSDFVHYDIDDLNLSFFDPVTPRYAAAFVRAMAKHPSVKGVNRYVKWNKISADFVL
jgi:hypothetical protein